MKVSQLTKHGLLVIAGLLALSGCEQEGPAEQAGENIDEAVEQAREEAQEASEQAMEKVEEATDTLEEKADSATD
jgi:hypothetical protein